MRPGEASPADDQQSAQDREHHEAHVRQDGGVGEKPIQHSGIGQRSPPPATRKGGLHAFNQWLHEDWGFNHKERLYAVPMLSLTDVNKTVAELASGRSSAVRVSCTYARLPCPAKVGAARRGIRSSTRSGRA